MYSWDGTQFVLDAEPYGGATMRALERTDVTELEHLVPSRGEYRLLLTNEMEETQQTNRIDLLVVDHAPGLTVAPDLEGVPHAFGAVQGLVDARDQDAPEFQLMCFAINSDIQSAEGSGSDFLEAIRRIEAGEVERIEADGNAWVAHITRDKVWFEGLYNQGEGGEVSFAQYKLAVQTYVRFLADPERKPIEVEFPPE